MSELRLLGMVNVYLKRPPSYTSRGQSWLPMLSVLHASRSCVVGQVTPEVANHPPDTPISAEAEAPDQPPVQFTFQEGRVRRDDDFNNITLKCGVKFYGKVITRVDLV